MTKRRIIYIYQWFGGAYSHYFHGNRRGPSHILGRPWRYS